MAGRPKKDEVDTNVEETKESVNTTSEDKEKEDLKNQVSELSKMVEQLLKAQKETKEDKAESKKESSNEEDVDINPNQRIKIISLSNGGLNLKGRGSEAIYLPEFGAPQSVSFEDLQAIYYNHGKLAREGAFFITDEKAVKALYLEQDYKNILNKEKLDGIFELSQNKMLDTVADLTSTQRKTFTARVVEGIQKGDPKYNDFNKIKALDKYIGNETDLYQLAQSNAEEKE